jgi:hypothetical protein
MEITVARHPKDAPPRVRADLTAAELVLEPLSWAKPPGRSATLQFDVVKGTKYKTELQSFRLVGDDIALEGWLGLDQSNRVREFAFPDLSLNVVSRLDVQGVLRNDNVWDIKAKGPTFDGRDLFRSLFSLGRVGERPAPPRGAKDAAGADVRVEVDNVIGHSEVALRNVRLQASKRGEKLTALGARGTLDGGKLLEIGVQSAVNEPRRLIATSDDAGQAFKLVGFYPNLQGGRMRLVVNLDGRGPAEKTGQLEVTSFRLLGDPVVSEVLQVREEGQAVAAAPARGRPQYVRQVIEFDRMQAPFSVGHGNPPCP